LVIRPPPGQMGVVSATPTFYFFCKKKKALKLYIFMVVTCRNFNFNGVTYH